MDTLHSRTLAGSITFVLLAALGCGGGSGGGNTSLSFAVPGSAAGALVATDSGGNTLVFASVEIVLRELEFEKTDGDEDCASELADDDDCEEVEVGPLLVSLALDGSTRTELRADIPPGLYEEVEFEVHKVSDDEEDLAFLQTHPEFAGISIRVLGSFNGDSFEFTSDVNAEQELEFIPPLEVLDGSPANVTITVDVDSWFRDVAGTLIDPATAGDGGANESIVENNIENSIDAFEDDDRDGEDDQGEDDDESDDED